MDRSSKATLPLTIPRPIFKSSAKDSSPRSCGIAMQSARVGALGPARVELSRHASGGARGGPTSSRVTSGEVESAASSMDSDLEAFSHNPTHGSFASLAFQPNAMTNYVNQRFLSY